MHCIFTLMHCILTFVHCILIHVHCILTLMHSILTLMHCILTYAHYIRIHVHCILIHVHCILIHVHCLLIHVQCTLHTHKILSYTLVREKKNRVLAKLCPIVVLYSRTPIPKYHLFKVAYFWGARPQKICSVTLRSAHL